MKAVVCTKIGDPNLLEIKDIEIGKIAENTIIWLKLIFEAVNISCVKLIVED